MTDTTIIAPLSDDAAFLAAERRIAELREQMRGIYAAQHGMTMDDESRLIAPLDHEMWNGPFDAIILAPPISLVSALVKLRLLADPDIGMHGVDDEMAALQQVLVYFERMFKTGGT